MFMYRYVPVPVIAQRCKETSPKHVCPGTWPSVPFPHNCYVPVPLIAQRCKEHPRNTYVQEHGHQFLSLTIVLYIFAIQNEQRCASVQVRTPQIPCDIPTMAQPVYEGTSDGSLGALDEKNITTFEPGACIAYLIFLVLFCIAHTFCDDTCVTKSV